MAKVRENVTPSIMSLKATKMKFSLSFKTLAGANTTLYEK